MQRSGKLLSPLLLLAVLLWLFLKRLPKGGLTGNQSGSGKDRQPLPVSTVQNRIDNYKCDQFQKFVSDDTKGAVNQALINWVRNYPDFFLKTGLPKNPTIGTMAKLLEAHSYVETGKGTSRLYREQNNLYGMKIPLQRRNALDYQQAGFAGYSCKFMSVWDLLLWFAAKGYPVNNWSEDFLNPNSYVEFLKSKGYFKESLSDYRNAMTDHYNSIQNSLTMS